MGNLLSSCTKQDSTRQQGGGGGGGAADMLANVDWMALGMQLVTVAKPYVVQYLGEVQRPDNVDMEAAHQAGETVADVFTPYEAPKYERGNVKALLIGINYYGTNAELSGCVNDVKQELATFQKVQYPVQEMAILVDDKEFPNATALPTRENIIKYMAWLVKDAKKGDVLFMHYSGHGTQTKSKNDKYEAYDQVICPSDYATKGCILDNDIFDLLAKDLPAGVKLTVLFDCCHSGSMLDLPYQFEPSESVISAAGGLGSDSFKNYHMKQIRDNNFCHADILMISGCADTQTSADVGNTASLGNGTSGAGGAATQCLTYILLHSRDDATGKEVTEGISYCEMMLQTRAMLREKKFTQIPQLSASRPIDLSQRFSLTQPFKVDSTLSRTLPEEFRV